MCRNLVEVLSTLLPNAAAVRLSYCNSLLITFQHFVMLPTSTERQVASLLYNSLLHSYICTQIIMLIIITRTMFIMLSSWRSHCESRPLHQVNNRLEPQACLCMQPVNCIHHRHSDVTCQDCLPTCRQSPIQSANPCLPGTCVCVCIGLVVL